LNEKSSKIFGKKFANEKQFLKKHSDFVSSQATKKIRNLLEKQ
jgi:hypothetical protein